MELESPLSVEQAPYPADPNRFARLVAHVMRQSPRPDPETARIAALAHIAGLCGNTVLLPTGQATNLYVLIVGDSGAGKTSAWMAARRACIPPDVDSDPGLALFVKPRLMSPSWASHQALMKLLAEESSCLCVYKDELGKQLAMITKPTATENSSAQVETLLTLYDCARYDGMRYSNKANSIQSVERPALTLVGGCTPGFYSEIDPSAFADGLLARFIVCRCSDTVVRNVQLGDTVFQSPLPEFGHFARWMHKLSARHPLGLRTQVEPDAKNLLDQFEDAHLKGVGNRAALNARRMSTLLGAYNNAAPVVTLRDASEAIRQMTLSMREVTASEFHATSAGKEHREHATIYRYVVKRIGTKGVCQWPDIYNNCRRTAAFKHHPKPAEAMRRAVHRMQDNGHLMHDPVAGVYMPGIDPDQEE